MLSNNVESVIEYITYHVAPNDTSRRDTLFVSVYEMVSVIDGFFRNWDISVKLKKSCIKEELDNHLYPIFMIYDIPSSKVLVYIEAIFSAYYGVKDEEIFKNLENNS